MKQEMATDIENGRPNIRIEIKNTAPEPMDVDDDKIEEGEIRESNFTKQISTSHITNSGKTKNFKDTFRKTIDNITDLEWDHKKLQERAKRFSLKPEEISSFTEQDLHDLYMSLGITADNADQIRYEAIHLRSFKGIDIDSVISYFSEYAPVYIECVDDESFNVVWDDKLYAARTLYNISQMVRGMPVRAAAEHVIDSFILEESDVSKDEGLLNENRQIELSEDVLEESIKLTPENSVEISDINVSIPPGYWRLGKKLIKSHSVLLRFSMKIDKKPFKNEKYSKYFKTTFSNKNIEHHRGGIFSRNKDINNEVADKNPWGVLARNWDEDLKFRERDRYIDADTTESSSKIPLPENSELRVRLAAKRRLGVKQNEIEEIKKVPIPEAVENDESDQENKRRELKIPRMRMYADEEEEKIKRRKLIQTLKKQTERLKKTEIPNSDLRNILGITNRRPKRNVQHDDDLDLSVNLKNRNRKLVFTVAQDATAPRRDERKVKHRIMSPIRERKPISPIHFKPDSLSERYTKLSSRDSGRRRHRSPETKRESNSRRKFGGRMYSARSDSEEDYSIHKPKSKVALVIKTQKKPSVASAIQSRSRKFDTSSSSSSEESESSDDDSEDSTSSSSESESDSSEIQKHQTLSRRLTRPPFKVEIKNEKFQRKEITK